MLRVTTLYAATASATALYYTRYLTQADGEQPGQWMGRQAAGLGLAGEVTTEALQALLEGRDPITGCDVGESVAGSGDLDRGRSCGRWPGSTPRSRRRSRCRRGGRCPVMRDSRECHDVAVRAVVGCIEKYGSTTRIRSNGHRLHPESRRG